MSTTLTEKPIDRVLTPLGFPERKPYGYWHTHCKAHADSNPSLYIRTDDDGNVIIKCLAGCTRKAICASLDITESALYIDYMSHPYLPGISVIDLAIDKGIHPNALLTKFDVTDYRYRGQEAVRIPYPWIDGTAYPRFRLRTHLIAKKGSTWSEGNEPLIPYGLDRLDEARKAGYQIVVEGESDPWTLWLTGFPALGVPGADLYNVLQSSYFTGIEKVIIIQEPDKAGHSFSANVEKRLKGIGYEGKIYFLDMAEACQAKDPNDLYKKDAKAFKATFTNALENRIRPMFRIVPPPNVYRIRDLQQEVLPETRWAIDPILPEGVTILAGKPKLGKSFLALGILNGISSGGMVLGQYPVERGEVLYIALEDGKKRLQKRSNKLLRDALATEDFYYSTEWARQDDGGLEALEDWIITHPRARLICIDTWARFKPRPKGRHVQQLYDEDYEAISPLQALAQKHSIAILVIDHMNKREVQDDLHSLLDLVTSSTGKIGGVDGCLLLYKKLGEDCARLGVIGRDIEEEQELILFFSRDAVSWLVKGNADDVDIAPTPAKQAILDALKPFGETGATIKELADITNRNPNTLRNQLQDLRRENKVQLLNTKYRLLTSHDSRSSQSSQSSHDSQSDQASLQVDTKVQVTTPTTLTTPTIMTTLTSQPSQNGHTREKTPPWYIPGTPDWNRQIARLKSINGTDYDAAAEMMERKARWLQQREAVTA